MYDILQLNDMLVPQLKELAEDLGLKGYKRLSKKDLIYKILDEQANANPSDEEDSEDDENSRKRRARKKVSSAPGYSTKDSRKPKQERAEVEEEPEEEVEEEPRVEPAAREERPSRDRHSRERPQRERPRQLRWSSW